MTAALVFAVFGTITTSSAGALPCSQTEEGCEPLPPGPGDDDGGGGGGGVLTTPSLYISGRSPNSLSLGWFVSDTATSVQLQHQDGAAWNTVFQTGNGGEASMVHGPLAMDSRHCYRLVARRDAQTKTSNTACGYTADGLFLRPLIRVQVQITTGNVANAGTDDDVRIGVGGPINGQSGGGQWLDLARDDFEQGSTHNYDLVNLPGITDLGDIESLELYKPGGDDWCLSNVTLIVNGSVVFSTGFGPSCRWVVGGSAETQLVQISHDTLHGHPFWNAYQLSLSGILAPDNNTATLVIPHEQIESHIESVVGDAMVGTSAYWAPPDSVHVNRVDDRRSSVDLDLKGDVGGGDPSVDVDFDLVVGTHQDNTGKWFVDITVENGSASIDPEWWVYLYLFNFMSAGAEFGAAEDGIEASLAGVAAHVGIAEIYDTKASFDADGNLVIVATLQCVSELPYMNTCVTDYRRLP